MNTDSLIFPTLVRTYSSYLDNNQCSNLIDYSKDKLSEYKNVFKEEGTALSTYNNYENILDIFGNNFIDSLIVDVKKYATDISTRNWETKLSNSWVNIQTKGSVLKEHTHGSLVTGVFFLKIDEKSNPLYLYNPNPYTYLYGLDDTRNHTASKVQVIPKQGDLLLFPGWMSHGSNREVNLSEERIVCSFNYG